MPLIQLKQKKAFQELEKYIDIKQYLKYHSAASIMNNSDGLTNNFYFYKKDAKSPFTILPWDFDKTFDPNANIGLYGDNAIIRKLVKNDSCFAYYKSQVRYILDNIFKEDILFPIIEEEGNKIKEAFNLDPYLGGTGLSLENEINILKNFIKNRRNELLNSLEMSN